MRRLWKRIGAIRLRVRECRREMKGTMWLRNARRKTVGEMRGKVQSFRASATRGSVEDGRGHSAVAYGDGGGQQAGRAGANAAKGYQDPN